MWSSTATQEPKMNKKRIVLSHTKPAPYQGIPRRAVSVKHKVDPPALPSTVQSLSIPREYGRKQDQRSGDPGFWWKLYRGCLLQWGDQGRHNNFQVYLHMFSNISPEKKGISCSPNISVVREARSNRPEVQQERLRLDTWKMGRLKSTECPGRVWDLCPCWYLRAGWKCQEYFWNQPLEVPSSCVFLWFCDEWC